MDSGQSGFYRTHRANPATSVVRLDTEKVSLFVHQSIYKEEEEEEEEEEERCCRRPGALLSKSQRGVPYVFSCNIRSEIESFSRPVLHSFSFK